MGPKNTLREEARHSSAPGLGARWLGNGKLLLRGARSVLTWAWVVLWGSVLTFVGLVLFLPFNPWVDPQRRMMERLNQLWGRGMLWAIPSVRIELVGAERLSGWTGPFVICPNHQSVVDIPLLLALLPPFKTVAKAPLFWLPPLGLQLRLAGHIPASRGEPGGADRVFTRALAWLRRGVNVLVFPEGTRSADGRVLRFGQGPFVLAASAGVPVLPVAISGSRRVAPKGHFLFTFSGEMRVELLAPVTLEGEPRAVASQVRALIAEALEQRGTTG